MPTQIFAPDTSYGALTINGTSMHTYAWNVADIRPLWSPQAYRQANVVIPHASGQRAYPYRIDQAEHQLPMYLTGVVNSSGTPHANRFQGLNDNIDALLSAILTPPSAPTATVSASITMPDTTVRTANVQVLGLIMQPNLASRENPKVMLAALHLIVPSGYFT